MAFSYRPRCTSNQLLSAHSPISHIAKPILVGTPIVAHSSKAFILVRSIKEFHKRTNQGIPSNDSQWVHQLGRAYSEHLRGIQEKWKYHERLSIVRFSISKKQRKQAHAKRFRHLITDSQRCHPLGICLENRSFSRLKGAVKPCDAVIGDARNKYLENFVVAFCGNGLRQVRLIYRRVKYAKDHFGFLDGIQGLRI